MVSNTSTGQDQTSQARMTNSIRMAIAIVAILLAFIAPARTTGGSEPATGTAPAPFTKISLGPYILETYGNVTKHQDRLRHSKSYFKAVIQNKLAPDSSPLYTVKITNIAELVRCEDLTLERPEMEPLVECRPLESYVLSDGIQVPLDQSNRNRMYAYRQSIKLKQRFALARGDQSRPSHVLLYALRRDEVMHRIKASQAGFAEFREQDYAGFYMEVTSEPVKCTLNVLIQVNRTGLEPLVEVPSGDQDSFLNFNIKTVQDLFNGFSLSVEDLKCADATSPLHIELHGYLKLVYQHEFPYLTVRHTMFTHPISNFFNFESEVKQTRNETNTNSNRYNTTVNIDSQSAVAPALNFKLDQVFVNEDLKTGWEEMRFLQSPFAAFVRANWTIDSLVKDFLLYDAADDNVEEVTPLIALRYQDEPAENDMVALSLRISRSLLKNLSLVSQPTIKLEESLERQRQHYEEL